MILARLGFCIGRKGKIKNAIVTAWEHLEGSALYYNFQKAFQKEIVLLDPNTIYQFTTQAKNSVGDASASEIKTFTTLPILENQPGRLLIEFQRSRPIDLKNPSSYPDMIG